MVWTKERAATKTLGVASLLLLVGRGCSSAMPASFVGGDLVATLKECGEVPVRTVSCIGAQGSGKSTLLRSMWPSPPEGFALIEATSSVAYVPETNEFEVGAGRAMVSLAVSDVTIYNVLVHDLGRPDALSDVQVSGYDFKQIAGLFCLLVGTSCTHCSCSLPSICILLRSPRT